MSSQDIECCQGVQLMCLHHSRIWRHLAMGYECSSPPMDCIGQQYQDLPYCCHWRKSRALVCSGIHPLLGIRHSSTSSSPQICALIRCQATGNAGAMVKSRGHLRGLATHVHVTWCIGRESG